MVAIQSAPAGATIRIEAGVYEAPGMLTISQPIQLIGAGMHQTRLVSSRGDACLYLAGAGPFTLQDMAFASTGPEPADIVVIDGGEILVQRCHFSGAVHADEHGGDGLRLHGSTHGVVRDCWAVNNQVNGIHVTDDARLTLEQNSCLQNGVAGISYSERASGTVSGNTCRVNGQAGIAIVEQAQALLEQNICERNDGLGIAIGGSEAGRARGNVCQQNRYAGIGVVEQAQPILEDNDCAADSTESG